MSEVKGKISVILQDAGSKSEGSVAKLYTVDGGTYTLYCKDSLPQNDPFFKEFDGLEVAVNGVIEEENGYICVCSIILADGTELLPPAVVPSARIVFLDEPAPVSAATKSVKRLPRKLKKLLKKRKNNI